MDKIADIKVFNDTFIEMVKSGQTKEAAVSAQQFTRTKLRENSFAEKVITPIDISNDELDKSEDPELLVKWNDREPDQAPAVTIPLGVVPDGFQFKGTRYPSYFTRLTSPVFNKDIDKLRSYDYDIRAIMLENSTKDIATEVDTRFISKINSSLSAANTANPLFAGSVAAGLPNYVTIPGGVSRQNFKEAIKVIQRLRVPFGATQPDGGASVGCVLMNTITASDFAAFERTEAGGDISQESYISGLPSKTIMGCKPIYTIKRDLIPDGTVYFFSSEEFLGKYYRLQPLTAFMKQEAYFLQFFQYLNLSLSLGNVRSFARVDFV